MVRVIIDRLFEGDKRFVKACGLSTDQKPAGVITGSRFLEVDTGDLYAYDEVGETWGKIGNVGVSEDAITAAVNDWLDDHPEATTTVEDGAISYAKLDSSLQGTVDDVGELKSAIDDKVDIEQGVAQAGKALVVGADGNVTTGDAGIPDAVKAALLACFQHVAWLDDGTPYYNALVAALESEDVEPIDFDYGIYEPEELVADKYIDADGKIQDGEAGASYYIADFIPVIARSYWIALQPSNFRVSGNETQGTTSLWSESNWRVSEYDANKNFIRQTHFAGNNVNGAYSSQVVTFASNTKYIRLGWYDNKKTSHVFEIESPLTFTELPMELGDVSASTGDNSVQPLRIRTTGYIAISGTTITVTGCPFAESWSAFSDPLNPVNVTSTYGIRCYDANKRYLGYVSDLPNPISNIENHPLLANTAFIRLIVQFNASASLDAFKYLVNHLFTINGVKYYVTGE